MITYSVVVPVFNAERTLPELCSGLIQSLSREGKQFEIILVDDRSQDHSWRIINELAKSNAGIIRGIRLAKNFGQHNATLCGLKSSRGSFVFTIDDDLQHDPSSLKTLIEEQERSGTDIVYGTFKPSRSIFRSVVSATWKFLAKNLNEGLGKGSSLRLMKSSIAAKLASHQQQFVFIDEVVKWYTSSISFIRVPHYKRKSGKSSYSNRRLFALSGNLILFYSGFPLRLMTWSGLFFSLVFFLLGLFFLVKKIFFKINVPGFAALIVTLLFTTGIILFCLGIVGEYIRRIYMVMNTVPNHSIAETTE